MGLQRTKQQCMIDKFDCGDWMRKNGNISIFEHYHCNGYLFKCVLRDSFTVKPTAVVRDCPYILLFNALLVQLQLYECFVFLYQ